MGDTHTFQKARFAVIRLSVWQLLLTLILAILSAFLVDNGFALSVFAGGMIGMLAGFYQAQRMMRVDAGSHPEAFMRGLWISEFVKIALTVALFVIAIRAFISRSTATVFVAATR